MTDKTGFAMCCTKEQFERIKYKLLSLGFEDCTWDFDERNNYLCLNKTNDKKICNYNISLLDKSRNIYKKWDEKKFFELLGIKPKILNKEKIKTQKETDFNKVVEDTLSNIQELLLVKGIEYRRNNDPFHNFSIGGQMTGQIPEKVLHGFLLKHLVSYQDMLNDLEKGILPTDELIQAKFNDILVYFIIQKAMFLNRIENQKTE